MKRRDFFRVLSAGGATLAFGPVVKAADSVATFGANPKPDTNIEYAKSFPRTKTSMPGIYPAKVVKATHPECVKDGVPIEEAAFEMLKGGMLALTGERSLKKAWRKFVGPKDIIGLKVNPVAGKLLSTSHALTKSVIKQLEEAGIKRSNIVIWDRREMQLKEVGYTSENYPGIKITGTECQDEKGGFYNSDGRLYSEDRVDKNWFFYADVDGEYDDYTIPYMVNGGKESYFSKICTQEVDKIINLPILKNAGVYSTIALKNLAYGVITNTGRLHKELWSETCAYVCAFPPVRDKVVLNIVDGMIGCFDGGPSAKPQFICNYDMLIMGSDPVAVDRVGHDVIIKKRVKEGIPNAQKYLDAGTPPYLKIANELGLGESELSKIELKEI